MAAQITLRNGEKVKVNGKIQLCPPGFLGRAEESPLQITFIVHLLEGASKGKGKTKENYTRVRLAWYYRPSDVSDRPVADSRLLLAAIYSEVCDISQLRSKCYVLHRDKISDLAGWKKRADRFYFNRLFDPYIKKEFEVIQATDVRNLPENIRKVLISRYEYVVAEKEVVPDLTDTLRLCATCDKWCAHPDTVGCDRCKKFFHMGCVQPPLLAKPSRGYGWTCAPCSKRHEEEVDSHEVRHPTPVTKPKSNAPAPRGRGRPRKDRSLAEKEENLDIKYYKMWPFRYFGWTDYPLCAHFFEVNIRLRKILLVRIDNMGKVNYLNWKVDPDDLIFPRAATRVGPKYQAGIPSLVDSATSSGMRCPWSWEWTLTVTDPEERGGDSTVEVLSIMYSLADEEGTPTNHVILSTVEEWKAALTRKPENMYSVDWLTEAIRRFSQAYLMNRGWSTVDMSVLTRVEKVALLVYGHVDILIPLIKWKRGETRYADREWSPEEIAAFEDGILLHGAELRAVRDEVGTRTMPEVVRFYGHWKNSKLKEENELLRALRASRKGEEDEDLAIPYSTTPLSDDEGSIMRELPKGHNSCGACRTRESETWWRAPKGLATEILCDSCGTNWRKYADLSVRPLREDAPPSGKKAGEKREGTPLNGPNAKRVKV
ncbi:hypothetical protein ID866_2628 [Astraeus odoratus]|nr:hypothetical protein ID866_2628 [Astraeus odoratus]